MNRELQVLLEAWQTLERAYDGILNEPKPVRMIVFRAQKHVEMMIERELKQW